MLQYGSWDRKNGLNITETRRQALQDAEKALANSTLRIAVVVVGDVP